MIACLACLLACFDAFACCMACLLGSISAAWDGFGSHFEGLVGGYPGHGLGSGLARGPLNGLDCTPARAGALFYQDPGIQGIAQVEGGFDAFGPYYQSNNCLIQGTFISELLDLRLRKVTVELFDWTAASQPGGTL